MVLSSRERQSRHYQCPALARTCKTLSEDFRRLVLQVNVVNFDLWEMHEIQPPRRCTDESDEFNANMTAVAEALEFF
jgi:hypothetical protein